MKKIINLIIATIFLTNVSFSQELGLEGKRFSVETDVSTGILINFMTEGWFHLPPMRSHIVLNYTLTRKNSIGLILTNSWYSAESSLRGYNIVSNGNVYPNSSSRYMHTGIGVKYSFFTKGFIAPVGSSWSIYAKYNTFNISNLESIVNNATVLVPFSMSNLVVGVTFEKRSFLSSKIPLYFKYGFGFGYGLMTKIKLDGDVIENNSSFFDLEPGMVEDFKYFDLVKFNFGLGYIF